MDETRSPHGERHQSATIEHRVRRCIAAVLRIDIAEVLLTRRLTDLGAQSFDFVDLMFTLEREFGITIARQYALPNVATVSDYCGIVQQTISTSAIDRGHDGL